MGSCLSTFRNICCKGHHVTDADAITGKISSTNPRYTVFISHAIEDKTTIAVPLREKLLAQGITAFVDEDDMPAGTEAKAAKTDAMGTATVAVIVLSPEYVARQWPMKEMLYFLSRRENSIEDGRVAPVIVPCFFRLNSAELYDEPRLDRLDKNGKLLYRESKFYERQERGEPEASIAGIKAALETVRDIAGVTNSVNASNDSGYIRSPSREGLLQELCSKVRDAVPTGIVKTAAKGSKGKSEFDTFHPHFDVPRDTSELFFDFDSKDNDGTACTQEGKLLEVLLDRSQHVNRAIAIQGIAGVGKTSLLRRIRSLKKVHQRFRDGIYNLSLGMHATRGELIEALRTAVQSSGGEKAADAMHRETDVRKVMKHFRAWFAEQQCLFIVDDVWVTPEFPSDTIHELMKLQVSGQESRVLLTTRSMRIASWAAECFTLEPRTVLDDESRAILYGYSGIEPQQDQEDDKKAVDEILERCDGLPLFLIVAGKGVKALSLRREPGRSLAYHTYAQSLKASMENLVTTNAGSYQPLSARLKISVELVEERKKYFEFRLGATVAELHRRLSAVAKQTPVPMSTLKRLWELESESQAATLAREFEQVGLADVGFERRGTGHVELLTLHDSIYEFAMDETRKRAEEKVGHEALLRGYGGDVAVTKGCREWWRTCLETDSYVHANICRHLLAAGCGAELVRLLMSPQWTERQLTVNGIMFLEADFSLAKKALQDKIVGNIDDSCGEAQRALQLISEAAVLAWPFVAGNFGELWFQLHGRLIEHALNVRVIREFLDQIEREASGLRVVCVNGFLEEPGGANRKVVSIGVPLICMVPFRDGQRAACGCPDGRVLVVDLLRCEIQREWKAHNKAVSAIAVREDRKRTQIVSGSWDRTAKVWLVESGRCKATFDGHTDVVNSVEVIDDEERVVSVSEDGTAQVWEMDTARVVTPPFTGHEKPVTCVAAVGDGEHVVTGGWDCNLRLWNATTGAQVGGPFRGHKYLVTCVVASPNGRRVISVSWDRTVRVWDLWTHRQIGNSFQGHTHGLKCVAISGDGYRIASGSWDKTIRVWDSVSGKEVCAPLEGHTDDVNAVSFLSDADSIVSCSEDGTLRLWDIRRQQKKKIAHHHGRPVSSVSFSPNGRFVVSGSYDNTLRIWNTTSGLQVGDPLCGHADDVNGVAVMPNGQYAVSVSDDKTLRVWDLESHELLHTFNGHVDSIYCVALTSQGHYAVTGSDDQTVRLWDLKTLDGSHVVLEGHVASVSRVFFSDDGSRFVSVDFDDNIFLWDLETKDIVKLVAKKDAWRLSRRQVLNLVGETTTHDNTTISIPLWGHEIVYGEEGDTRVLATLESEVWSWALSPDKQTICVGLGDGQVAFMKLER